MSTPLTVEQVDLVAEGGVIVALSDGRTIKITLKQILACDHEVLPEPDDSVPS